MKKLKKKTNSTTKLIEKYYPNLHSHLEYPNEMIYEHLFDSATSHPNYIAYEYFGRKITYQKFIHQINECAKALKGIGTTSNEVITICTPNMPEAIIMFYAINMIGAIANIIHPLSSENEILEYLKISNSTKILTIDITVSKIVNILKETKLTECTAATCLTIPSELRDGCIGIPFPDTECKIVKVGTHDEVDANTIGEICFTGPTMMIGYVNNEKETMQAKRIHNDGICWLHTGDIGYKDEEGMIFFKQQLKRIIISSGYNLYPSYIESVIDRHPAVKFSTVIGIDHPYKVQVAKAFIVLNDEYKPNNETLESIKRHCEKNIAKYSLPYEYEFRKSIPKTKIGKIAFTEFEKEEKGKHTNDSKDK